MFFNARVFLFEKQKMAIQHGTEKKNALISGNAGDKKNLHLGGRKFIFF